MNTHVNHMLNRYHDGELSGKQRQLVEAHLRTCPICRQELERLNALSMFLRESLPADLRTHPGRFAAQVGMQLPQREPSISQQIWRRVQTAIPFGLAGLWGFVQAVFLVAFSVQALLSSSLIPELTGLMPTDGASFWVVLMDLEASPDLLELGGLLLNGIRHPDSFAAGAAVYLIVQFVFGILFCAWIASWYAARARRQPVSIIR